jgi:F0F1-type ATP synthase epsilon subunit
MADAKDKTSDLSKTELTVTVRGAEGVVYEGKAELVSSSNPYGYFDILPRHKNFITNIEGKVIIKNGAETKEFEVESGILKVDNNTVEIFLGIDTVDIEKQLKD